MTARAPSERSGEPGCNLAPSLSRPNAKEMGAAGFHPRYTIKEKIGSGPNGAIFQALDLDCGEPVALKLLHQSETGDPLFSIRFRQLGRKLLRIKHPGLVTLYDYGFNQGQYFQATQLVGGASLRSVLTARGRLPAHECGQLGAQICEALTALHGSEVLHLGLKPENILLDGQGGIKLTDAGLAAALSESGLSKSNLLRGSVHYLSPEQARGDRVGPTTDLYGLGVVLFELLTGRPPFETDDLWDLVRLHGWGEPPPPSRYVHEVPPALEQVLLHSLQKDPRSRFASPEEMGMALNDAVAGQSRVAAAGRPRPFPVAGRNRIWTRSRRNIEGSQGTTSSLPFSRRSVVLGSAVAAQFALSFFVALAAFFPLVRGANLEHLGAPFAGPSIREAAVQPLLTEESPPTKEPLAARGGSADQDGDESNDPGANGSGTGDATAPRPPDSTAEPLDQALGEGRRSFLPSEPDQEAEGHDASRDNENEDDKQEADDEVEDEDRDEKEEEDREREFWGHVETKDDEQWRIAGRNVLIRSDTELEGRILVGSFVRVEAIKQSDGRWRAMEIELEDESEIEEDQEED